MRDQHYKSRLNSHDPSLQWSIDLEYHHNQHHDSSREGSVGLMVGMPTWELRRWRQAWVGRQNLSTYDLLVMWGDHDDDIYIMMQCLSVTKNEHFLKRPVCQPWKWRNVVSWFLVGFLVFSRWFRGFSWFLVGFYGFQGSFIVFHGFWLVSMVFQGSFMVFHGFWLVFQGFSPECTRPKLYPGPTIQSRSAARRAA